MFEVSTIRGEREFSTWDYAAAYARFMHSAHNLENIMITHESDTWKLIDWYGKPKFQAVRPAAVA